VFELQEQGTDYRFGEGKMNLKELRELIELVSEKGIAEFEMERQGFRLRICRNKPGEPTVAYAQPQPLIAQSPLPALGELAQAAVAQNPASAFAAQPTASPVEEKLSYIKSEIVGTFYRRPSPNKEPFVNIGDRVENDTVVCVIEAMKLMNEIPAEMTGEIVKICVEDGHPVEYGTLLFGIRN
jgi:acetyl-CoA carboxylase biotin carboxyl carrier protein